MTTPPFDPTDAALAVLHRDGTPHKGGILCPACDGWVSRHDDADHARHCAPLRTTATAEATDA